MIKKITGTISRITDLSDTAKEVAIALPEPLAFRAGSFVNLFMEIGGAQVRRAFSISSPDSVQEEISLSIRRSQNGVLSPLFWERDLVGTEINLMGPLGLNTVDRLQAPNVRLFGFGVGAGVIKSLLAHVAEDKRVQNILVMTGSRTENEILHKEYFDTMAKLHPRVEVRHVVSQGSDNGEHRRGYIQDHLAGIDFADSDIYVCGQGAACDSVVAKIKMEKPRGCMFFVEAFH